jgi:hypothetical protein
MFENLVCLVVSPFWVLGFSASHVSKPATTPQTPTNKKEELPPLGTIPGFCLSLHSHNIEVISWTKL